MSDIYLTYHLDRNVEHSLEVKLAAALLEEVLKGLAKQIHNHNVVHLAVFGLFVTHKVKEGHESLSAQLVNQL